MEIRAAGRAGGAGVEVGSNAAQAKRMLARKGAGLVEWFLAYWADNHLVELGVVDVIVLVDLQQWL